MMPMKKLDLILPFSIPPSGLEKDLLRSMKTPSLAKLIAPSRRSSLLQIEEFSKALPHEFLIAGQTSAEHLGNSPADTWNRMQHLGLDPQEGTWFTLQPVHIHFASDHLVLMDTRRLQLSDADSRELFTVAKAMCDEVAMELRYGDANTWFLRADAWAGLITSTADAACGHNIDIWMAQGQHARAWRKLQNEIQMAWFSHSINQAREDQGLNPINSLWISGGGTQPLPQQPKTAHNPDVRAFIEQNDASESMIVFDALIGAAINSDWGFWLENMHMLEENCFTPLLSALQQNRLQQLNLICTDATRAYQFTLTPWSLRKFWVKPSLTQLFSLHSQ